MAFLERFASYVNPILIDPLVQPLTNPPSMRYFDAYSSYILPPASTTTQSFGVNPSSFVFPEGLRNLYFSTTHVVDIVGSSSLLENIDDPSNPTQPFTNTSPFAHGSGNIIASIFPHMHTPSALLGCPISHMVGSQVVQKNMITQSTQPPSHTFHISTPYIGGQSSIGEQPSTGGEPLAGSKIFTGRKITWLKHQQAWGKILL
jgi:hypothetical protein